MLAVNWKDATSTNSFQHLKKLERHDVATHVYMILGKTVVDKSVYEPFEVQFHLLIIGLRSA